jgi:peptidoglycan/xylan/chitin deacetylase (PgdA/CDA1 family)
LKLNKMVRFSSLFVLALFLCGAVCSLPLQGMGHNGKVAVMADSRWNWANGWPETDYLSVLRETVSALDYLGYRYDLINETIAQDALNSYAMVISIAGTQGKKIISYCTTTGRTAFVLYDVGSELSSGVGIAAGEFVLEAEDSPQITNEGVLTAGLVSEYGSLPLWGAYNHRFNQDAKILLTNSRGLPVLVEQKVSAGRYVFLLTRALTWNAYSYRLMDNVIRAATDLSRIGGVPYAMDVPVLFQLDDFSAGSLYWQDYVDVTKKLTVAAIMSQVNGKELLTMRQAGVEVVPHGYNHEDLSALPYQQQTGIVTQAVQVYRKHVSAEPEGYTAPYNRINADSTRACHEAGLSWITTYHGMANIPRHYYEDYPNHVWVLGARPDKISDPIAVKKALAEGAVENKPLLFVERPHARKAADQLDESLLALKSAVASAASLDGCYLTGLQEYFRHLVQQQQVYRDGNSIVAKGEVAAGLTFAYPGCDRDQMMQLGTGVLMFYRKGSTVLPALSPGRYPLTPVKDMPVLLEPGPGVVIKSAVYYPLEKRSEILLEAFYPREIELCLDRIPVGSYKIEIVQPDGKETGRNATASTNKDGKLKIRLQLPQDTVQRVTVFHHVSGAASSS